MPWNYLSISKLQRYYICILQVIELMFTYFDVEPHWGCQYDNLTVFDGASTSSPSLGTYCGNQIPDPVTTSGNTATMLFITDGVARYPGFSIDFTARDLSWTNITSVETTSAPLGSKNGSLTHPLLDKMDAILADDIFKWIFLNENGRIPIQISLKFVPTSPIDNKPALV